MSGQSADHGPIAAEMHEPMNALAHALDDILNGKDCPSGEKKVGFFLTTFNFNETDGRFNYISNADKIDVRTMLKDILARIEGRMQSAGQA